jgi:hypothetical protein
MIPSETLSTCSSFSLSDEQGEVGFEEAVGKAVNDILTALGENTKQVIYSHLKNSYGLSKDEIPGKIETFSTAIEETFGSVGKLIEIKIIEKLHSQYVDFRFAPKNGKLDFVEYITCLQNRLEPKA